MHQLMQRLGCPISKKKSWDIVCLYQRSFSTYLCGCLSYPTVYIVPWCVLFTFALTSFTEYIFTLELNCTGTACATCIQSLSLLFLAFLHARPLCLGKMVGHPASISTGRRDAAAAAHPPLWPPSLRFVSDLNPWPCGAHANSIPDPVCPFFFPFGDCFPVLWVYYCFSISI
jgi:hypothetical protein